MKRFPELDSLRAFAIASVVLFHYFPVKFPLGWLGVDLFFCSVGLPHHVSPLSAAGWGESLSCLLWAACYTHLPPLLCCSGGGRAAGGKDESASRPLEGIHLHVFDQPERGPGFVGQCVKPHSWAAVDSCGCADENGDGLSSWPWRDVVFVGGGAFLLVLGSCRVDRYAACGCADGVRRDRCFVRFAAVG